LQEHKKSFDNEGDPIGQCLAAMLVAQTLHQEPNEVGCRKQPSDIDKAF
jgi:hypothetical protein